MASEDSKTNANDASAEPDKDLTFESLPISSQLRSGIYQYGFAKPSRIQCIALPICLSGGDALVQSPSGTGKMTAAAIVALQAVKLREEDAASENGRVQVLVLLPSREFALAARSMFAEIGKPLGVRCVACFGGVQPQDLKSQLEAGADIVIGTPGRAADVVRRGWLDTADIRLLVLAEADDLVEKGFEENIVELAGSLPDGVQTLVFSATVPNQLRLLLSKLNLENCPHIRLSNHHYYAYRAAGNLSSIRHYYIAVDCEELKVECLFELLDCIKTETSIEQVLVLCTDSQSAKRLVEAGKELLNSVNLACLHNALQSDELHRLIEEFLSTGNEGDAEKKAFQVLLVAEDVCLNDQKRRDLLAGAAIVICVDLPAICEAYALRLNHGSNRDSSSPAQIAISFVTNAELPTVANLKSYYAIQIDELPADLAAAFGKSRD